MRRGLNLQAEEREEKKMEVGWQRTIEGLNADENPRGSVLQLERSEVLLHAKQKIRREDAGSLELYITKAACKPPACSPDDICKFP
ncbi:hypothetical protein ACLOJK_031416, partial [Asimina triloba]